MEQHVHLCSSWFRNNKGLFLLTTCQPGAFTQERAALSCETMDDLDYDTLESFPRELQQATDQCCGSLLKKSYGLQ